MGIPIRAKHIRRIRIPCKALPSSESFSKDFQMLQYFQSEFEYRHKHCWSIMIKMFILTVLITIIPITSQVLEISFTEITKTYALYFPAVGFIVAWLGFGIVYLEFKRMTAVNKAKLRIIQKMGTRYQYEYFSDEAKKHSDMHNIKKSKYLAFHLPIWMLVVELIIILIVFIILYRAPIK